MNDAPSPDAQSTPARVSGSSFYLAMRVLPQAQREAMFEVYSFCRAVDDIADSTEPHEARRVGLQRWRQWIEAIYAGSPPAEVRSLAATAKKFELRKDDFLAVIDGMDMDAAGDIRAPDWQTLDLYCDRVASAVGRLSVRIFGIAEPDATALAHHLGRALQLTNILRDLDEDATLNRLYLPQEALGQAGIASHTPAAVLSNPSLSQVCDAVARRARGHFEESNAILSRLPRSAAKAPRIMAEVYRNMLENMMVRGWSAPRERVRIGRLRLFRIILQYAIV